jgi:HK97 family phage portal protein
MERAALSSLSTVQLIKLAIGAKLKETFYPKYPMSWGGWLTSLPRTDYHYAADVGSGLSSSVVAPVVQFIQRAFPEAPLVVRRRQRDELELIEGHPLAQLVERPNAFYPGTLLWMVTVSDWCCFGESYWRILRTRGGRPGELWWLPPWSIEPKWPSDGSAYLSHYTYQPEVGTFIDLDLDEVLHFRHGLDPSNPRHGLPPLRAVLRDIWTDNESANLVAALLRNMGIPGLIITPKGDAMLSPDEVERVKAYVHSRFVGDHRGEPLALGGPTDVHRLAWSPSELDLTVVRNLAEERVCASLGIPAAVVGFGTGLENSKVGATMSQFVRLAWANGIVPMQRLLAAELQRNLLPQFETNTDAFLVGWDYDEVSALEADQNELAKRAVDLYQGGVLMRSESRQMMGYEANEGDDIYLVPSSMTEEGPDAPELLEPQPTPLALPGANGNGQPMNGNGAVATRAAQAKQGSLDEWVTANIGRTARRMDTPPQSILRLAAKLWRAQVPIQRRYEPKIREVFARYAERVALATGEVLRPQKASVENVIRTAIIHERIPLAQIRFELEAVYREMYAEMLELFMKAMLEAGHPDLTDPARVLRQLNMAAGQRAVLLDLSAEARSAILSTLEQATAAGLSEEEMVAAIKDAVPRGRWRTIEMRAEIIARTESRYSLALASAGYAREHGMSLLVLDSQLGSFDQPCDERRGMIVTPSQAEMLAGLEHPQGTYQVIMIPSQVLPVGATG